MSFQRIIFAIDSHTAGEPMRTVVGGIPFIPGKTMAEKKRYFEEKLDDIRNTIMQEPRGHRGMFGAILTSPANTDADLGVIWIGPSGYAHMCGHGTIAVATTVIKTGIIKPIEPNTDIIFDTEAGSVVAHVKIWNGKVKSVTIRSVPSFLFTSTDINIPKIGSVPIDVSFGGNFFVLVNAKDIGVKVKPRYIHQLTETGLLIKDAANAKIKVRHPAKPYIDSIFGVRINDDPTHPHASVKNVVVFNDGQIDRSPGGTGTFAYMATQYMKGQLKLMEESMHESIIGSLFKGRVVAETVVGDYKGVILEVTGNAYITGMSTFVITEDDPLGKGFLLR